MEKAVILVVEDERVVALDIRSQLRNLGYDVPTIVSRGEDAVQTATELSPDLVLMDIHLRGEMDGIQAAQHIRTHLDIPVIYLTAYADDDTLQRAKVTEPFGYVVKPFEERELYTTIEMALYKHRTEQELAQSQRWLSAVLQSIGDAVIATDAQGHIKFMNPVAQALTGWDKEQASGREVGDVFRAIDGEMRTPVPSPVERALAQDAVVLLDEGTLLITRDGDEVPIDDSAAPIKDERQNTLGAVLVFRDVSERLQARDKLRGYASELESRNQELDAFAHTVAHDLKSPLSTIIGFASALAQEDMELPRDQMQEYLQAIEGISLEACNVVDELLLLASVRDAEVEKEPLEMSRIVDRAEYRLAYLKANRHAEISYPDQWPAAKGYGPWVEEVWVNYLSNGIKYGGDPPRLELGATQVGNVVRFWVRDNGAGIAPEDQKRLFTPFTRLHQARATGHGLGLSIVQRIVNKLGGDVWVESCGGQGSTFFFTLPAVQTGPHGQNVWEKTCWQRAAHEEGRMMH